MKKILIISDSAAGNQFIKRVVETYTSDNIYYVVQNKLIEYENASPSRFKFYEFDSTSFYKISNLLKMEFVQVFIAMDNKNDVINTIKNIRSIKKQLRIIILDKWDIKHEYANIVSINSNDIIASKLFDYLPNVPVIAQNIGIGEGEIMEVSVPFGSSFVYRHIGVIEQKGWRIVAIYRNRKLILPTRRSMVQPNDILVLIGEPPVLKSVYTSIKKELGQFPEPYGTNLYLYIDMDIINKKTIKELVSRAVFSHKKFKHKLIIKIVNPSDIEIINCLKDYSSDNIVVDIDYEADEVKNMFMNDIKLYDVGLIIVSKDSFADFKTRTMLYEAHVPVLKISDSSFSDIKDSVLILSDNRNLEKISSTIFDISEQMDLNIELYNYLNEHQSDKEQVVEHYYNLSSIFSKSIKVFEENKNPIITLKNKKNYIHILPFSQKLIKRKIFSLFSTDSELLYHKLDDAHQIFIPV